VHRCSANLSRDRVSAWPAIAADLRRALLRAGTRVDEDVAWALLACEADRRRRRAQAKATARSAQSSG